MSLDCEVRLAFSSFRLNPRIYNRNQKKIREGCPPHTETKLLVFLNQTLLLREIPLRRFLLEDDSLCLGGEKAMVDQAASCIQEMLYFPILVKTDVDFVIMRILRSLVREFSAETSCWLHVHFETNTVCCFGLNSIAANDYIEQVTQSVQHDRPFHFFGIHTYSFSREHADFVESCLGELERRFSTKARMEVDIGNDLLELKMYGCKDDVSKAILWMNSGIVEKEPCEKQPNDTTGSDEATSEVDDCTLPQAERRVEEIDDDVSQPVIRTENEMRLKELFDQLISSTVEMQQSLDEFEGISKHQQFTKFFKGAYSILRGIEDTVEDLS